MEPDAISLLYDERGRGAYSPCYESASQHTALEGRCHKVNARRYSPAYKSRSPSPQSKRRTTTLSKTTSEASTPAPACKKARVALPCDQMHDRSNDMSEHVPHHQKMHRVQKWLSSDNSATPRRFPPKAPAARKARRQRRQRSSAPRQGRRPNCIKCGQDHPLCRCDEFRYGLTARERVNFADERIAQRGGCVNCFRMSHTAAVCHEVGCRDCNEAHNSLLCKKRFKPNDYMMRTSDWQAAKRKANKPQQSPRY